MWKNIIVVVGLTLLFGCSSGEPSAQAQPPALAEQAVAAHATEQPATTEADHFLVFFLDPNGGPCQRQDAILGGMVDELKGKVELRYVQTNVPADREYFYAFGIRGLPSLLLADSAGKEISRLPPGVNSAESIRGLLTALPN